MTAVLSLTDEVLLPVVAIGGALIVGFLRFAWCSVTVKSGRRRTEAAREDRGPE
jgi:hypothetical protein